MKYYTVSGFFLYSLIMAILLISVIFFFAMKDGSECLGNPLVYGANKGSSEASGDLICSCSFTNPSYAPFYFNKENITVS